MALFLSKPQDFVLDTIKKRIKWNNYDTGYEKWYQKTPWIKLFSNMGEEIENDDDNNNGVGENNTSEEDLESLFVIAEQDNLNVVSPQEYTVSPLPFGNKEYNYDLSKRYVLFGSTLRANEGGFQNQYTPINTLHPLRPLPIITDISITTTGTLGSLRKATVNFMCFTTEQLNNISKVYMTPGISCILQWGWSSFNEGTIGNFEDYEYFFDVKNIKKQREDSEGNTDSLLGIITNFEWSFNEDGSFSCNIELTSMGSEVLFRELNKSYAITKKDIVQNIKTYVKEDLRSEIIDGEFVGRDYCPIYMFGLFTSKQIYVPMGFIEEELINKFVAEGAENKKMFGLFRSTNGKNSIKIKNHSKLRPMDNEIFLLMGQPGSPHARHVFFAGTKNESVGSKYKFGVSGDRNSGYYRNILISLDLVEKAFVDSETVQEAIELLLKKLNQYSTNYWDLIVEPSSEEGVCRVIDKTWNETNYKQENGLNFSLYKKNSIIRSISMSSNLPDKMKTVAMYSMNADDTSNDGNNLKAIFGNVQDKYLSYIKNLEGTKELIKYNKRKEKISKEQKENQKLEDEALELFNSNRWDNFNTSIDERYWEIISELLSPTQEQKEELTHFARTIPVEVTITLDGISGLEYGNAFTVDYLPDAYENTIFRIKGIEDSISSDGWTTQITGQMNIGLTK